MKNYLVPLAALLLCGAAATLQAQDRDSVRLAEAGRDNDSTRLIDADWRLGFDLGGTYGAHASSFDQVRTQARAYLRHQISYPVQVEFGLGIGRIAGTIDSIPYDTRVIPVDLRGMFAPIVDETLNPYVYLGLGATYYDHLKPDPPAGSSTDGWALAIPLGVGLQYKPKSYPTFAYDLSIGYNLMLSDKVNGVSDGGNASFLGALVGFEFLLDLGPKDSDDDGITDADELGFGTDPKNADTDHDGLSDSDELNVYRTNALKADTDNDGLSDSVEINTAHTNPVVADTDGDGIPDGSDQCPLSPGPAANKGCPSELPER
jgi:hypothetical protein